MGGGESQEENIYVEGRIPYIMLRQIRKDLRGIKGYMIYTQGHVEQCVASPDTYAQFKPHLVERDLITRANHEQ